MTFLMKLDPGIGKRRVSSRNQEDRLESEKVDFHQEVYNGYLQLEKDNPDRIFGIDASRGIEEIRDDIYKKLEEVLSGVIK